MINLQFDTLELQIQNVPEAITFFRDVIGLEVKINSESYAELAYGLVTIKLGPNLSDISELEGRRMLQFEVENVTAVVDKARRYKYQILLDTTLTPWGTETARISGPENIILDLQSPNTGN